MRSSAQAVKIKYNLAIYWKMISADHKVLKFATIPYYYFLYNTKEKKELIFLEILNPIGTLYKTVNCH